MSGGIVPFFDNGDGNGSSYIAGKTVDNPNQLPDPIQNDGLTAIALNSSGFWGFASYKPAGVYFATDGAWDYLGDYELTNEAYEITVLPTGGITETDVQGALAGLDNRKVTGNFPITGATKTKITYNSKGLVTEGNDATTADIADSTNKRYVTDAQLAELESEGTWMDLVARPSVLEDTIAGGTVRRHSKTGKNDIFRFVPFPYDSTQDAFYKNFNGIVLTNLITVRG